MAIRLNVWRGFLVGLMIIPLAVTALVLSQAVKRGPEQREKRDAATRQARLEVHDKVGGDIEALVKESGLCNAPCPNPHALSDNVTVRTWEVEMPGAILDIYLSASVDSTSLASKFHLKLHWSSIEKDGNLTQAPRLAELVQHIRDQYHFPNEYFLDGLGVHYRGNSEYWSFQSTSSTNAFVKTGHESMRGERAFGISRTGPFRELGSWRLDN